MYISHRLIARRRGALGALGTVCTPVGGSMVCGSDPVTGLPGNGGGTQYPTTGSTGRTPEQSPHIKGAIYKLNEAAGHLRSADKDFHGHRSAALSHVMQALEECRLALASDAT